MATVGPGRDALMTIGNARIISLAAVLAACAAVAAGCGGSSSGATASTAAAKKASSATKYEAPAQADPVAPAPDFTLRDVRGAKVSLSQFRGKAVLLTFIYSHCPDTCPLMVGNLHSALEKLGSKAGDAQVIAVSVDPKGDTAKAVKKFVSAHEMKGRMRYLIGSKRELAPVWKAYNIRVKGEPEEREGETGGTEVGHSALVYGISGSGKLTTMYPADFKPQWVAHDVPILAAR